jgi:transcriptional regulator with XRE-family HTH domain
MTIETPTKEMRHVIAKNLKRIRTTAKLTLRALAAQIPSQYTNKGISHGYLRDLEIGAKQPSVSMLEQLAEGLSKATGRDIRVRDLLRHR